MVSLDALSGITDQRKVRLHASLRQGQAHDFFGTALVLNTKEPPLIRIYLNGKSGKDRPSARAMDPDKDFYIRLGIGSRAASIRMHMHKVESDDQALFEPVEIEQEEQNRAYFRVRASFEIKIIPRTGAKATSNYHVGQVRDISGGGLLMLTSEHYKPGTVFDLEFGLQVHERHVIVLCSAVVVRCVHLGEGKYETGVQFQDLLEEQRDAVMAYCFARQREMLREQVQVKDL
jgi:hypothetical protein